MRSPTATTASNAGVTKLAARLAGVAVAAAVAALTACVGTASAQVDPCPNAQFRTGASAHLPECRAYEQVSPVDKNGFDIEYGSNTAPAAGRVSVDGNPIFTSDGAFAGQPFGSNEFSSGNYSAYRAIDGWRTVALYPRPTDGDGSALVNTSGAGEPYGRFLLQSSSPLTGEHAPEGGLYLRDEATGSVELLVADDGIERNRYATSANLEHVAFLSNAVLTSDPGVPPPGHPVSFPKAYEWANGSVRLVSVRPDGTPFQTIAAIGSFTISSSLDMSLSNAVSKDGSHVFFSTPGDSSLPPTGNIYRRSHGATTVLASPSKRTDCADDPTCGGDGVANAQADPLGPRGKAFVTATPAGDRVFFTSPEELTDDANTGAARANNRRDLYRYDVASDELVDISAETNTSDGARVQGMLGASDDGDWAYYVALGQVVAGQGTAGRPNLYVWHDDGSADGESRFIATLEPGDSESWRQEGLYKASRVTPDGQHALFESRSSGVSQVYLYDARADGGTGALACISCSPAGVQDAPATVTRTANNANDPETLARNLLDDGQVAFFDSRAALVPEDTNGRIDAYMWQAGNVRLLSTGKSQWDSRFYGASADGDDALFLTRDALVAQDRDTYIDIYDARVNGGVPALEAPVRCAGVECQGPPSRPPAFVDPGSRLFDGRGNAIAAPRRSVSLRRVTARQRIRLARGRRVALRAAVGRGRPVRVVVHARLGGRQRLVARGRGRAGRGGTAKVRIRLARPALRRLARGRVLRIRVTARSAGAPADRATLRLKRPRRAR